MNNAAHIVVGVVGILLVVGVWRDVIDTVVTTRHGQRWSAARKYFEYTWRWYSSLAKKIDDPAARERFLVPYGPVSLVGLLAVWVALLVFGPPEQHRRHRRSHQRGLLLGSDLPDDRIRRHRPAG